ncbi:MAG TPA: hypothetical protein VFR81_22515 [Longimicrobium sp.]|nr:hypothetical protein [Longimicrobium sp.]
MRYLEMYDAALARLSDARDPSEPPLAKYVAAAEERMGARIPAALRQVYFSHAASWLRGLIAPDYPFSRLAVVEGALQFWEGRGHERVLGIAEAELGADDPPLVIGRGMISDSWLHGGPVEWEPFVPAASGFLLHALHASALRRHMRFRAARVTPEWEMVPMLRERFPEIGRTRNTDGGWEIFFGAEGRLISAEPWTTRAGARTAEDAAAIEEATGGLLSPREDVKPEEE